MLAVIVLIVAVVVSDPIKEQVDITTNTSNLDCTNSTTTAVTKATCTVVDTGLFYFIGILIGISIAFITGNRNVTGIVTSIFLFIVVAILITPLKDLIILIRDSGHLNCGSDSISLGANLACIVVDIWLFYFIVAAIATAIALIVKKKTQ